MDILQYSGVIQNIRWIFLFWNKVNLRASSYEPGNRAGSVTGTNFVDLFIWEISARSTGMKFKKQNQNGAT